MKIKLLRVFVFTFACVMGTSGVSVWGAASDCESGQYWDTSANTCKNCYLYGQIGTSGTLLGIKFDYTLWSFEPSGEGEESCRVKLNIDKSNCDTGTNVVYKYKKTGTQVVVREYVFDTDSDYTVVPDNGYAKLYTADNAAAVAFGKDHCGKCASGEYIDDNTKTCVACPLEGTNAKNKVGPNARFQFIEYGDGIGITSCTVKLNPSKDGCSDATNVVYVYNATRGNYIRKVSDVFAGAKSIVANPLPATNDMGSNFCISCGENTPYNVKGECSACKEKGYYLEELTDEYASYIGDIFGRPTNQAGTAQQAGTAYQGTAQQAGTEQAVDPCVLTGTCSDDDDSGTSTGDNSANTGSSTNTENDSIRYVCKTCPAGYYCPGKTENDDTNQKATLCPANTYAEEGQGSCTSCPMGFFTQESGPVNAGYDGLCSGRKDGYGIGCVSRDACKFKMSKLCINGNTGCFTLDENKVNVESVNRSVVKEINQ